MENDRKYFDNVNEESYKSHARETYKERNGFTDTTYFKIVSLSMKFYKQGFALGKDIEGNDLTSEEREICNMLIDRMTKEVSLARKNFEEDHKED